MSLDGLEKLRMGYVPIRPPLPPPLLPNGRRNAITCDEAFDAWVMLPEEDLRTLQEYAENPVPLVRRLSGPPPPPPSYRDPGVIVGGRHILELNSAERIEQKRERSPLECAYDLECNHCHVVVNALSCPTKIRVGDTCLDCGAGRYNFSRRVGDEHSRGPLGLD
jgi:hypothetical protein